MPSLPLISLTLEPIRRGGIDGSLKAIQASNPLYGRQLTPAGLTSGVQNTILLQTQTSNHRNASIPDGTLG